MKSMATKTFFRVIDADRNLVAETSSAEMSDRIKPKGGEIYEVVNVLIWDEDGTNVSLEIEKLISSV